MLFHFECLDKPGAVEIRKANRSAHLAYLEAHEPQIVAAGPLLAEDGETPVGSALILDLADRAAADRFAAEDPYAKAGLFGEVRIRAWRKVFPRG